MPFTGLQAFRDQKIWVVKGKIKMVTCDTSLSVAEDMISNAYKGQVGEMKE